MVKYYKKNKRLNKKLFVKTLSFSLTILGILVAIYIFLPLFSWQVYFAPVFANQELNAPIPKNTIVRESPIASLVTQATQTISGIDYTNAQNWFPDYKSKQSEKPNVEFYKISIPKIGIKDADVSTIDINLTKNLINYGGTAIPPEIGNAVIFGHSTLPQLFNKNDYKTIFSNLYKLSTGDEIIVNAADKEYKYIVDSITIVDPNNTSVLQQDYDDSFLTLITCTPPGTIWKRLIVKSRLEKI